MLAGGRFQNSYERDDHVFPGENITTCVLPGMLPMRSMPTYSALPPLQVEYSTGTEKEFYWRWHYTRPSGFWAGADKQPIPVACFFKNRDNFIFIS